MPACLIVAGKQVVLAGTTFLLSWTHSVERTEWRELWVVTPRGLQIAEARVRGSGAGMEPGDDARLEDGWWVWTPDGPPLTKLVLAASGTAGGWRLCHDGGCRLIGRDAGAPIVIAPCPPA